MDAKRWREVVSLLLPVDETVGGLVGGVVGGWAGAVPVPLDWYVSSSSSLRWDEAEGWVHEKSLITPGIENGSAGRLRC